MKLRKLRSVMDGWSVLPSGGRAHSDATNYDLRMRMRIDFFRKCRAGQTSSTIGGHRNLCKNFLANVQICEKEMIMRRSASLVGVIRNWGVGYIIPDGRWQWHSPPATFPQAHTASHSSLQPPASSQVSVSATFPGQKTHDEVHLRHSAGAGHSDYCPSGWWVQSFPPRKLGNPRKMPKPFLPFLYRFSGSLERRARRGRRPDQVPGLQASRPDRGSQPAASDGDEAARMSRTTSHWYWYWYWYSIYSY